jgi:hypothetical protein
MSTLNIYLEGLFTQPTLRKARVSKTSIPNQLKPIILPHSFIKTSRKNSKKTTKKYKHNPLFWSSSRSKGWEYLWPESTTIHRKNLQESEDSWRFFIPS